MTRDAHENPRHVCGQEAYAMTGSRIALVAEDQRLVNPIQAHLKKTLGQTVFLCPMEAIRTHLGRESDGVLLLLTSPAAEGEPVQHHPIHRLVQELFLQ